MKPQPPAPMPVERPGMAVEQTNGIHLTLGYPPSANRYWAVYQGRVRITMDAREYKRTVQLMGKAMKLRPLEGPVSLSLTVYRPRRIGDLSNRIKVLEDALEGVAFHDDDQVEMVHALRLDDASNPRVEVVVEQLPWRENR